MYVLNANIWTEMCHAFAVIFIGPAKTAKTVRFKSNIGECSNGKLLIAFIQCMLPFYNAATYDSSSACVKQQCDHVRACSWDQCSCCEQWYGA